MEVLIALVIGLFMTLCVVSYLYWENYKDYYSLLEEKNNTKDSYNNFYNYVYDIRIELSHYYDFMRDRCHKRLKFRKTDLKKLQILVDSLSKLVDD